MLKLISFLSALFLFSGCTQTRISNFEKYNHIPISDSRYMPSTSQIENGRSAPRIIIKPFGNHTKIKNADAVVTSGITSNVFSHLNATIIDRDISSKLGDELTLSKTISKQPQKDEIIEDANFIIRGEILSANVVSEFQPGHYTYWKNKKGEQVSQWNEPTTSVSITTSGTAELVSLPNAKTLSSETCSGKVSKTFSGRLQSTPADLIKESLLAFSNDVFSSIEKSFSTTAFVSEIKSSEDDYLVKITAGKKQKLQEGNTIYFLSNDYEVDPLTKEKTLSQQILATGLVSSVILENYSWVVVDEKDIPKIRRGMSARTRE